MSATSHPIEPGRSQRPGRRLSGEDRRAEILAAAMDCFAERGFRGTKTRALADRAGISEAALYRYFPSKESLYAAIIDEKMAAPEIIEGLRPAAARGDDRAVFGGLAREIFARVEADPSFLRILYFTALEGHALADQFFVSRVARIREFVSEYIAARIEEGRFRRVDPVIAARAFLGMIFDHLNVRLVFRQTSAYSQSLEQVADTFVSIFLGGMRVTENEGVGA